MQEQEKLTGEQERIEVLETRLKLFQQSLEEIYNLYNKRIEELSLIRRLSDSLRGELNLKKACLALVVAVQTELTPDGAFLFLKDRGGRLRLKASIDEEEDPVFWSDSNPGQAAAASLIDPLLLPAARDGEVVLFEETDFKHELTGPVASLVALPLLSREDNLGVLALSSAYPQAFDQETVRLLTIICDQASAAMINIRLFNELKAVGKVRQLSRELIQVNRELTAKQQRLDDDLAAASRVQHSLLPPPGSLGQAVPLRLAVQAQRVHRRRHSGGHPPGPAVSGALRPGCQRPRRPRPPW